MVISKSKDRAKRYKTISSLNNDIRISEKLRGKHINASWQINLFMGCKNLEKEI